ncbi:MAG: helix-hairpin-helix domain-containing protein [Planctomycetes bacterium]|nr:helix-hairpin-helix domain-containing protein [Planctomycetota bacterium]
MSNADIQKGWRWLATLDTETALESLLRDGFVVPYEPWPRELPTYGVPQRDGIWVPELRTWKELGIPLKELAPGTRASMVGPVEEDGGSLLQYLIARRRVVESTIPIAEKEEQLRVLRDRPQFADVVARLGTMLDATITEQTGNWRAEYARVTEFRAFVAAIGYRGRGVSALFDAGLRTREQIASASDQQLRSLPGIGPKTLLAIRSAIATDH